MATYIKIASVTVGSGGAANIDFTSIPSTYTDLLVKFSGRTDTTQYLVSLSFNGSTSNFTRRSVVGDGSTTASFSGSDGQNIVASMSSDTANTFGNTEIYVPNYAGSTYKSVSIDTVEENNGTTARALLGAILWSNTAAITSFTLTPVSGNFVQYSTATLYGISNA
jgi:hypothetical protein